MNCLGLDLSLRNAGIVVVDGETRKTLHREVAGADLSKNDPYSVRLGRMLGVAAAAVRAAREHNAEIAYVEGPSYASKGRLHEMGGLHYVVGSQLRLSRGLKLEVVAPTTARKLVLGRGQKPKGYKGTVKDWVHEKLVEIYGIDSHNEHIRDAVVVAFYGLGIGPEAE